jgi:hypothetical protein
MLVGGERERARGGRLTQSSDCSLLTVGGELMVGSDHHRIGLVLPFQPENHPRSRRTEYLTDIESNVSWDKLVCSWYSSP